MENKEKIYYVDKNFPTLEVGSKVYVKISNGAVRVHQIEAFRILNYNGELRVEVVTRMGRDEIMQKYFLDTFLIGISEAQNMRIADIRE